MANSLDNSVFGNGLDAEVNIPQNPPTNDTPSPATMALNQTSGLVSGEDLNDPNSIRVTITDHDTPIVVLYGPPACGKTMTLVRLARYLLSQGFTVTPDRTFRPAADSHYRNLCDTFDDTIYSDDAAESTNRVTFMLVTVMREGRPICQILEAPGELYFNGDANAPYPPYVHEVLNSKNRKVWAFMVEPNWRDAVDRNRYCARIAQFKGRMTPQDKVLFVFNKIDTTGLVYSVGQVNTKQAVKTIMNQYPNIFVPFKNTNPVTKWFQEYNCEFVPFTTGDYATKMGGGQQYTPSHDAYPNNLWKTICNLIGR